MSLLLSHECASAQQAQKILIRNSVSEDKTLKYMGPSDNFEDVKLIFAQYDKIHQAVKIIMKAKLHSGLSDFGISSKPQKEKFMRLFTKLYLKMWHIQTKYKHLFARSNWREADEKSALQEYTVSERVLSSWGAAAKTYETFAKNWDIDAEAMIS